MDYDRPHQPFRPPTPPPPPPVHLSHSPEQSPSRQQRALHAQERESSSSFHAQPSREENESTATVTKNTANPQRHGTSSSQHHSAPRRPTSDGAILLHPASSQENLIGSPSQSVSFHTLPHAQHEQIRSERLSRNIDNAPLPPLPRSTENLQNPLHGLRKASLRHSSVGHYQDGTKEFGGGGPPGGGSGVDWIVPVHDEKAKLATDGPARTVAERLTPTLETARAQRDRFAAKAKKTGRTLNIAIGAQVLLGSLTTGLSALGAVKNNTAVATTILGAMTTVVASYLARTRGSNEPELSITRVKDLEKFIRELEAYILDFGHYIGSEHDVKIAAFRSSFEEILGNNGEGYGDSTERRLAPPV